MGCRELYMEAYRRKEHFAYFTGMAFPYVGATVQVDLGDFAGRMRARGYPLFLSLCYAVSGAANAVPEFRQRIRGGGIVEYDRCRTSHTVALEDGTYCYCTLEDRLPLEEYIPYAAARQEEARRARSLSDGGDPDELLFLSTLPWLSYTALVQPVPVPADSNPRITWGRYFEQGGRTLLPVTVLCHHALVDGVHIARFFRELEDRLGSLGR